LYPQTPIPGLVAQPFLGACRQADGIVAISAEAGSARAILLRIRLTGTPACAVVQTRPVYRRDKVALTLAEQKAR
jgi:hypothetical protein